MNKQIDINHTFIKTPVRITVDSVTYPLHKWNIDVVREYWLSNDEDVLEKLKNFSLDI